MTKIRILKIQVNQKQTIINTSKSFKQEILNKYLK
jgi:hypothetical protein